MSGSENFGLPSDPLEQQREKIAKLDKAFARKNVGEVCPMCGNTNWYVPPVDVRLQIKAGTVEIAPPVAMLTCSNCGFLRLHNMLVLDIGSALP